MVRKITRKILHEAELKPVKHRVERRGRHATLRRGQNFLVSAEYLKKIVASAQVKNGETVLEIGPGTGNLTQSLLDTGAEVIAVEKDRNLCEMLNLKYQNSNIKIIEGDILSFDEIQIKAPYKVVANIPYYITGKIIQKFLFSSNQPQEMILMVQREVGERICGQPPQANYLSSLVQSFAEAKILFKVKRENFWPKPKVDSVVIRITPIQNVQHSVLNIKGFVWFLRMVFRQPRQTLANNLKRGKLSKEIIERVFTELKISKNTRPQDLSLENLTKIFETAKI